jgi:hypothetical protein
VSKRKGKKSSCRGTKPHKTTRFYIPQNVINGLLSIWKDAEVEWGGGLDFEAEEGIIVPPQTPEQILIRSGQEQAVVLLPESLDMDVLFHLHPKTGDKMIDTLNATFSTGDIIHLAQVLKKNPALRKKQFLTHLLIGSTGQISLMRVPCSFYGRIKGEMKKRKEDIKQFRSEISTLQLHPRFKKELQKMGDWDLFLHIVSDEIGVKVGRKAGKEVGMPVTVERSYWDIQSRGFNLGDNVPENKEIAFAEAYAQILTRYIKNRYGITIRELKPPYEIEAEVR